MLYIDELGLIGYAGRTHLRGEGKGSDVRMRSIDGRVETSFKETGRLRGVQVYGEVTWWSDVAFVPKEGQSIWGKGVGIFYSQDGEKFTWDGFGTITRKNGKITERGSMLYTAPEKGAFAWLEGLIGVCELEISPDFSFKIKVWEWK
jgi:hypothetical protein